MPRGYIVKDRRRASKHRELLKTVTEDLSYIRKEWDNKISDAALRRGSIVLRRLLVDQDLMRAWSSMGMEGQFEITAGALAPILAEVPLERIELASAGGARHRAVTVRGTFVAKGVLSRAHQARLRALFKEGVPTETLRLKDFLKTNCLVVYGEFISRYVLINYVANKLGGGHYDPKRSGEEHAFTLLDAARRWEIAEKPAVYFELLAIGQALAAAPSTAALQDAITEYLDEG